jgi:sterol 3beta-glucosyltransferase
MKVLILTLGTRGDVQPFIALARELQRRGHHAVLAAPERFADLAATYGVEFAGVDDGPLRVLDSGSAIADVAAGGLKAKMALMRRLPPLFTKLLEDCWEVASFGAGVGADVVVHNGQVIAGQHIAEKLGVPAVLAIPVPIYVPTRAFPWPGQPFPSWLPSTLNRFTYLGMTAPALMFGRTVDRWREGLRLPRRRNRHDPLRQADGSDTTVLHAVSPSVIPRPADWPNSVHMTGYWFLDSDGAARAGKDLRMLFDEREPLVFVGFGSMVGPEPAATTDIVHQALSKVGVRGVLAGGWGGLTSKPHNEHFFVHGQVAHDAVFPQCSVIVHHGGAGTTAAAARAGRPQVVCPFVADQAFWARQMQRQGVAPAPVEQRDLTTERLASAIERALASPMTSAAHRLSERVRAEDGVGVAVDLLERVTNLQGR